MADPDKLCTFVMVRLHGGFDGRLLYGRVHAPYDDKRRAVLGEPVKVHRQEVDRLDHA
jgi:hypothetical protein